jgi:hypothetical protein
MSSLARFPHEAWLPERLGAACSLRVLGRWLYLPGLILVTSGGSILLSVEVTRLLLTMLHTSGPLLWASHVISISVPLMVAPASTWLVGGLIVRAQASRRRSERLATIDPLTGVLNGVTSRKGPLRTLRASDCHQAGHDFGAGSRYACDVSFSSETCHC